MSLAKILFAALLALPAAALAADEPSPWQPEQFPISYWCGPPAKFTTLERYKEIKEANFTYAFPILRNRDPYNQVLNMASFWLMAGGMTFMTFTLTFAGVVQTHLQRVLGQNYMEVQDQLSLFYYMRFGAGVAVVLGAVLFVYATLVPQRELIEHDSKAALSPAE